MALTKIEDIEGAVFDCDTKENIPVLRNEPIYKEMFDWVQKDYLVSSWGPNYDDFEKKFEGFYLRSCLLHGNELTSIEAFAKNVQCKKYTFKIGKINFWFYEIDGYIRKVVAISEYLGPCSNYIDLPPELGMSGWLDKISARYAENKKEEIKEYRRKLFELRSYHNHYMGEINSILKEIEEAKAH